LTSGRQVPAFHKRALSGFTPPPSRMPLGPGSRAPPELIPGATTFTPVSTSSIAFRQVTSGSLVLVSTDLTLRGLPRLFLRRSPPTFFTATAPTDFETLSLRRPLGT